MTRLLAVETSSEACSVALSLDGETREVHEHAPMRHAELLLPAISSLLAQAGMKVSDLDAIAFGRGPGSFTSLRIGIGVVQGLAWAADVPVVPCSSLAAVACAAVNRAGSFNGRVCVAVDARMQEVFSAEFTGTAGALAGALVPIMLKRLSIDPALAGGVVLTTVTDVIGIVAFIGLASFVLLGR